MLLGWSRASLKKTRTAKKSLSDVAHPSYFFPIARGQTFGHGAHVPFLHRVIASTFRHRHGFFRAREQLNNVFGEGFWIIGKRADLAVVIREAFRSQTCRYNWNSSGEGFE